MEAGGAMLYGTDQNGAGCWRCAGWLLLLMLFVQHREVCCRYQYYSLSTLVSTRLRRGHYY